MAEKPRRPPSRGRGLKYNVSREIIKVYWSPPLAGAWIEIKRDDDGQGLRRSPPLAGGVD